MSRKSKLSARIDSGLVEVKSKFDAEFRRFSLSREHVLGYDDFYQTIERLHCLQSVPFVITYTDPEGDLLPINNNENYAVAVATARPLLRVHIQRKGQSVWELSGYGTAQRRKNKLSKFVPSSVTDVRAPHIPISLPEDFRRVSAIIDVDVVPASQRRVRLMKSGVDSTKPLGFYIRDGTSIRVTPNGVEKVPGIFISRLVPGGIAESTGLLAVNDEVMEVNGIEVAGKTLDQVTDMMVANSSNMIITVKPANQNNNIRRGGPGTPVRSHAVEGGGSQKSSDSYRSALSGESLEAALVENDEEDEVTEHVSTMAASSNVLETEKPGAWHTGDAQSYSDKGQRKISEVSTLSSGGITATLDAASARNTSDQLDQSGLPTELSRGIPGSGNSSVRSSNASSRSARMYENVPGRAYEYQYDDAIPGNQLLVKTKDREDAKGPVKATNNNEVKPSSGVKVIFTPVEDL